MWSLSGRAEKRRSNRLILAPWSRIARACGILVADPSTVPPDIRLCRPHIGANELADVCQSLETAGKEEDWGLIDESVPNLDHLMGAVESYINGL